MDNRDDRVYPWRLNAPSQGYGKPKKQVGLEEKKKHPTPLAPATPIFQSDSDQGFQREGERHSPVAGSRPQQYCYNTRQRQRGGVDTEWGARFQQWSNTRTRI